MGITCNFDIVSYRNGEIFYSSKIDAEEIPENQDFDIFGIHHAGKKNSDVLCVEFDSCIITKIPQGLTKIFPNLKILYIRNTTLKYLSKNDLVEYKNLERFHCETSEVEFLPGDLFEDFKNLEWIGFDGNKLNLIEPNILDGLENLKYVHFGDNANYNIWCSDFTVYRPNATLKEVKEKLSEKFKKFCTNIEHKLCNNSISSDLKTHIKDEKFKDFTIEIDGHKFCVHRFLLAARSQTLANMLYNNFDASNLKLVDVPIGIFELILNFIYTDEFPQDYQTNFLSVFAVSSRLKIIKLANFAASKVIEEVNETNMLEILEIGNKYNHEGLCKVAFEALKEKYPKIKFNDEWTMDAEKVKATLHMFKKIEAIEQEFLELMKK